MKALIKTDRGPGHLELQDWPVPAIGDDDILLEVKAAGICGSDMRMKKLGNSENLRPPVVVGHEFAGVIKAVGKNVKSFSVGERIVSDNSGDLCGVCEQCARGNYLMCEHRVGMGSGMDGGFAKYVKIPGHLLSVNPHTLYRIPENVSFEDAACLDPICNAYKAVVQESSLMPGQDVVIFGLGTIGLLAVQIASIMGAARIIGIGRSYNQQRFEVANQLGATHLICSDRENPVERISEITRGEMVPVIIDAAGKNEVLEAALQILTKGGEFIKIGYDDKPVGVSLDRYVNKGIRIQGHFAYDYVSWKNCIKLLELGKLNVKPIITHKLPLSEWEKGFELTERREGIKVILIP
ncbi:MAG: alcohol dehydrogenase catalytic domain-containing protein [Firmicutes bacterium]|nr:alcohol dehydrogenase catalytic domain-containing protein [Bacillota bacterium]